MSDPKRYWIWILGEVDAYRWIVQRNEMAFALPSQKAAATIRAGDCAVIYMSRGAWHNPTRDQTRLAGCVEVTGAKIGATKKVAGRRCNLFVGFRPHIILPERSGPEMRYVAPLLDRVKRPEIWGRYFQNSPIEVSKGDFRTMLHALQEWHAEA